MPKGNNKELIKRLEHIRVLVDESIALTNDGMPKQPIVKKQHTATKTERIDKDIDFSMPARPFVKKYSAGMSGPKKFTLILAFLASGDESKKISLKAIKKCWNSMTAKNLLGMEFNLFFTAQAKVKDWVNTEKSGVYYLRPSWKAIFNEKH